jgi:hypothetical protein
VCDRLLALDHPERRAAHELLAELEEAD